MEIQQAYKFKLDSYFKKQLLLQIFASTKQIKNKLKRQTTFPWTVVPWHANLSNFQANHFQVFFVHIMMKICFMCKLAF